MPPRDDEANRLTGRLSRYARVGTNVAGAAASIAASRLFGTSLDREKNAADLTRALGGLKGPIMKVAQLRHHPGGPASRICRAAPRPSSKAPPMGPAFVKRRMMAELGADWEKKFASFDKVPAAAASLGQVHRATAHDGMALACKLQYPRRAQIGRGG